MSTSARRSRVIGTALVAAFLVAAACLPMAASATPGDSEAHAVSLTLGTSTAGTLTPSPTPSANYLFVYSVQLTAGQTLAATYTVSPAVAQPDMLAWASFRTDLAWFGSAWLSPTIRATLLLAPKTGRYYLTAFGRSTPGTFTVDATLTAPIDYTLSSMGAPKTAKKNKAFKVSATLVGRFDELNVPVRFMLLRKSGRLFKPYGGAIKATLSSRPDASHTVFKASLSLPAGTYQVRARFLDAAHSSPLYNAWRTVTVK